MRVRSICLLVLASVAWGQTADKKKNAKKLPPVEQAKNSYLEQARKQNADPQLSEGSLFRTGNTFSALAPDSKARRVNDLIVINIIEQTTSQAGGSVQSARSFSANSSLVNIPIGHIGANSTLQNLFSPNSANSLKGAATTASNTQLSTTLTGRVIEVLPNGVMVVQAEHSVSMNQETQTMILRGLVRPFDVQPDNSVLSTSMANLEIELKGKGVISDGTRQPNILVRTLLKIFNF